MSSKIRLLDDKTINKIAAGEVIESPASCIKELIENALDANAKQIDVEIVAGGRKKITVRDDGEGMSQEDALAALKRHATSKLTSIEDMQSLMTMGFRGEALPSIASISKFHLKTAQQDQGTYLWVEGGKLISQEVCAQKKGTSIEIFSLFYNVPARKAFQKSLSASTQEITKWIMHFSFAHPKVGFSLKVDQKQAFDFKVKNHQLNEEALLERIEFFYGKSVVKHLVPITLEKKGLTLKGFLARAHHNRPNRTAEFFYINQRWIQSKLLASALEEGYGTRLPPRRFPMAFLFLELPPDQIDVNVHPQKLEVRFKDPERLKARLTQLVNESLQDFIIDNEPKIEESLSASKDLKTSQETFNFIAPESFDQPTKLTLRPLEHSKKQEAFIHEPHLIGIFERYFLVEAKSCQTKLSLSHKKLDGLLLIDQKKAKERLFFDHLIRKEGAIEIQNLLLAQTLEFSKTEADLLRFYLEDLNALGISIRPFKDHTFLVDGLPAKLNVQDVENILCDLLEDLLLYGTKKKIHSEQRKRLALAFCRAVQYEKNVESEEEAKELIKKLMLSEDPWISPRGAAIIKCLDQNDLSKLFNTAEK